MRLSHDEKTSAHAVITALQRIDTFEKKLKKRIIIICSGSPVEAAAYAAVGEQRD